jgi:hypothetical protein
MNDAIGDEAAIIFAASFYRALGFGRSVQEAFDQGKVALLLEGILEEHTPELLVKAGIDPSQIVLVSQTPPLPASTLPTEFSGKERKRERLFNAYTVILNAAEEYEAVLHQLGYGVEGETKETRNRRLNTTLQKALEGVNDAMITLTLEDVGTDVKIIFDEIRQAFHSYASKLEYSTQYPNEFSSEDLLKNKKTILRHHFGCFPTELKSHICQMKRI